MLKNDVILLIELSMAPIPVEEVFRIIARLKSEADHAARRAVCGGRSGSGGLSWLRPEWRDPVQPVRIMGWTLPSERLT
jgi:hypothetical protein